MLEAAVWSFAGAASLLIGVELVFLLRPSHRVIGLAMAFGAGAMISAVSFELVEDAVQTDELLRVALGIAAGSLTFFAGDLLIERAGGGNRKKVTGEQEEGSPLAIVLGATLDGVPESLIVGMTVVLTGGASASFVAATFLSNLPESMAAASGLSAAGWARWSIRLLWLGVIAVSVLAGTAGYALFSSSSEMTGALVRAFAAGALLTMLADTMMPEAFRLSGRLAGLLTVAGFVVALAIAGA